MKYDTTFKSVSTGTFRGKKRKATKPAGKQPAKVGCKTNAFAILCAKAAALGVERLWSAARITLTDNRKLIKTARLMQLLQLKLNMGLLEDSAFLDSMC
jgi:hypothetical protein